MTRKKADPSNTPEEDAPADSSGELRRFESALGEVEGIVSRLENGQLGLAESLDQYQKGIETLKECHRLLAGAERRITLLSGFDADGNPVTTPFDEAEMSLSEKQSRRRSRRGVVTADSAPASSGDPGDEEPGLF